MRRRDFIQFIASSTAAWPLAVRAQQSARARLVGVLMGYSESDAAAQSFIAAFRDALAKLGWIDGGNVRVELRWGNGEAAKIKAFANELVSLRPDVILGETTSVIATLASETRTVPIVFVQVADPLASGFVTSLARPNGNLTGFTVENGAQGGKWIQLLKEIAPRTHHVALLRNPATAPPLQIYMPPLHAAASSFGLEIVEAAVHSKDEIEAIVIAQSRDSAGALIAMPDPFNGTNRDSIIALVARYNVPALYFNSIFVKSGGLIAYGADFTEQFRQAAGYVDRILKGAKIANLPVQEPTKFELAVNLRTAKQLALTVPPTLLATADEVIE